jgi:hydroxyacyl-ACP dehydratase HTD2-like protein with hotdog domain
MNELTLADLGLTSLAASTLPAEHAQMLAATLDASFDPTKALPLLWHWAYFNPVVGTAGLGPDGHPRRGSPLLADFPRRMWVGGEVRAEGPLRADTAAVRRTRLLSHARKQGSTGELLVVTLEHTVEQDDRILVVERQDVIYRQDGGVTPPAGPAVDLPLTPGWRETIVPTTTLLFRFSAVTFNGHRIHYDHDYATRAEHYPDLVVHGPLTAMLLAQSASHHLGKALQSFAYRASSPLFVDQPVCVDGVVAASPSGETATMTATRVDGVVGMTATVTAASES